MGEARGEKRDLIVRARSVVQAEYRGKEGVSAPLVLAPFETDAVYNPKP